MILKFLIEVIGLLAVQSFQLINDFVPHVDFASSLLDYLDTIILVCTQACNCFYFIIGDSAGVLIPLVFGVFLTKLTLAPILRFLIGFIHWGG